MKLRNITSFGAAALLSLGVASSLSAQSQAQPAAEPASPGQSSLALKEKPKTKKVWTEDDISSVRKPWDQYQDQKAAAQQKPSATATTNSSAQAAQATPGGVTADYLDASGNAIPMPKSADEAQALVHQKEEEIGRKKEALELATRNFESATVEMERSAMKSNLLLAQMDLQASQDDLKELQARMSTLKPGPAQGAAPNTPASQPGP